MAWNLLNAACYRHSFSKLILFLSLIGLIACGEDDSSPAPDEIAEPDAILLEILEIVENNSVNRLNIDWEAFREEVLEVSESVDREAAIRRLLTLLGDNHSFYEKASGEFVGPESFDFFCSVENVSISPSPESYGYVKVSSFGENNGGDEFAENIQASISEQSAMHPDQWVVDLTENGGGNMWPMIAGLGPFYENETLGYFIDPLEQEVPWGYDNGSSWLGNLDQQVNSVATPFQFDAAPKVAVVFDNTTASSGEATLISFIGRPNTRIFGLASCGLSTANSGFLISNGDLLILTVSTMADRNKSLYGGQVIPDETFDDADALQARILEWLGE